MSGVFAFQGTGYDKPGLLDSSLIYTVPADKRAQLIYLRAGNSSQELAFVSIMQGGKAMRTFPVGARAAMHVPLAVVEDLEPDTVIQVFYGAPEDVRGTFILDIGLIEI
jgi:hypothetical protein